MKKIFIIGLVMFVCLAFSVLGAMTSDITFSTNISNVFIDEKGFRNITVYGTFNKTSAGYIGDGMGFRAPGDYADVSNQNWLEDAGTFNLWYRPNSVIENKRIWTVSGGNSGFLADPANGSILKFQVYDGDNQAVTSSAGTIKQGVWIMITVVYDGSSEYKLYVNATNIMNLTQGDSIPRGDFRIGHATLSPNARYDEFKFWDTQLTNEEIMNLYLYNDTNPPVAPSAISFNNVSSSIGNNTQYSTNYLNINVSANFTQSSNCSLIINDTNNQTIQYGIGNYTDVSFDITLGDGTWTNYITCYNNQTNDIINTTSNIFFIDSVNPAISWITPSINNNTVSTGIINSSIQLSDNNLYSYQYNITYPNGTKIYNFSNNSLTGITIYNITDSFDLSAYPSPGGYNAIVRVCDGHTAQNIKDFYIYKDISKNEIVFDIIKLKSLSDVNEINTVKLDDRYNFEFVTKIASTQLKIQVPQECKYIPSSGYKGHFVCEKSNKWIDFESKAGYAITVDPVQNIVTATSKKATNIWNFNSIGELNCFTQTAGFFVINSTVYNKKNNILENEVVQFNLNVTYNGTYLTGPISATLYFDGNAHSTTGVNYTTYYSFGKNISIPLAVGNQSTYIYNWTYAVGNFLINLSNQNLTVNRNLLTTCGGITNTSALNISFFNVTSNNPINIDFEAAFTVWSNNASNYRNYSFTQSSINKTSFCIYPQYAQFFTDATMTYSFGGNTYNYNLNNFNLSNSTQLLNLYVTDDTTLVEFTVTDQDDSELENILIHVLAYDVGTNSYNTVEILQTDYQGIALGNIILNTQPYKFLLYQNSTLILETTNTFITTTSRTFRVNLVEDYFTNYGIFRNIVSSLTFNNATKYFTYTFSDRTGTIHQGCLKVIKRTINGDTELTDQCVSSVSSSILYHIGNDTGTNTYLATGYVVFDDNIVTDTISVDFNNNWQLYDQHGLFAAFFVVITALMIGIFSPVVAIVYTLLGVIISTVLGLWHINWIYLITLLILGGMALFKMNKR